jgi:NAD(P)-dependent dehydrogenase (short-subunit alcohol dehydrogenase family)
MDGATTATVVITGAGTGIGALTARSLAAAGHTVYATMRDPEGRNRARATALREYADETATDLRVIELDVTSSASAAAATGTVIAERGGIDVLVHNAGRLFPPGTTGDPQIVADAITTLLATPAGHRPRRVVADASDFGAEPVNGAAEEQRLRLARRMGITALLEPAEAAPPGRR